MEKTVLVTGGAGDIGSAICRRFFKSGYNVAVNYLTSEDRARRLCEEFGGRGMAVKADVGDSGETAKMFLTVRERFGGPDVLVNNAGYSRPCLFDEITDEQWARTLAVNLSGCFYCCREAAKLMIPRKRGRIINISSIWGIVGASCEADYSAAKAGVIGLTKALAKELGPSGITVNAVAPGVIETRMNGGLSQAERAELAQQIPLERFGTPEEIAETVFFTANSDYITGQVISPNGGYTIF